MDGANAASADSPSKASSLSRRVASVVVLIPIVVAGSWWLWTTAILTTVALVIALVELFQILRQGGHSPRIIPGLAIGLLLCGSATLQVLAGIDLSAAVIAISVIGAICYELIPGDRSQSLSSWAFTFSGAYYIGGLLSTYILFHGLTTPLRPAPLAPLGIPPATAWLFCAFAVTWLQDTAAYFVGRSLGRHKMAPILSPKKSWEGAAGGMAASILSALLAAYLLGLPIGLPQAALIGLLAGVAGPLGDLAESLIKRQIGVKDSGQLIPGHGGILDRIDSLIFTGPLVYYLALLLT